MRPRDRGYVSVAPLIGVIGLSVLGVHAYGLRGDSATGIFDRMTSVERDCADLATQAAAQAYFNSQRPSDPRRLDPDGDGRVCELRE